jgi:probable rRNA maturation factor
MENLNFPEIPFDDNEIEVDSGIFIHFEELEFDFSKEETVVAWLSETAASTQKPLGEVSYIFCNDEYLHKINLEHLQHDDYTDVITFPYSETKIEGDIFISIERIRENAASLNVPFLHELCRVMVHGLLHLNGHSDKTAELRAEMTRLENHFLDKLPTSFF